MGNRTFYVIEKEGTFLKGVHEDAEGLYVFTDNIEEALNFQTKEDNAPKQSKNDQGKKIKDVSSLSKHLGAKLVSYSTQAIYKKI